MPARALIEAFLDYQMVLAQPPTEEQLNAPPGKSFRGVGGYPVLLERFWDQSQGLYVDPAEPESALEVTWLLLRGEAESKSVHSFTAKMDAIAEAISIRTTAGGVSALPGEAPTLRATVFATRILSIISDRRVRASVSADRQLEALTNSPLDLACDGTFEAIAHAAELEDVGLATACLESPRNGNVAVPSPTDEAARFDVLLHRQALEKAEPGFALTPAELDDVEAMIVGLETAAPPNFERLIWRAMLVLDSANRTRPRIGDVAAAHLEAMLDTMATER